jgi:hypothetical protein
MRLRRPVLERCKTCGRTYTPNQTMTYSVYGYCSWDCLMNKKARTGQQNRVNRKNNGHKNPAGQRVKWA